MATITVTRTLLEQGAYDDIYLLSAFQRNSMEFDVERGALTGTYATVLIGNYEFRAVKTATVGTTGSAPPRPGRGSRSPRHSGDRS